MSLPVAAEAGILLFTSNWLYGEPLATWGDAPIDSPWIPCGLNFKGGPLQRPGVVGPVGAITSEVELESEIEDHLEVRN